MAGNRNAIKERTMLKRLTFLALYLSSALAKALI
jgi:hypothetical protein